MAKDWSVLSVRKAQDIFRVAQEKRLPDCNHEGRLLCRNLDAIRVAKAARCKSERQARFLAGNGQEWYALRKRLAAGEPKSLKYMNTERFFVCVETAVLNRMCQMERVAWHADHVRDRLFHEEGESVLPMLCTLYRPPPTTPEEAEAMSESGSYRLRDRPAREYGDPPPPTPTEKRWYVIVDVWAFNERRREFQARARVGYRYCHDGECLHFAVKAEIQATAPLRAKELYRDKHCEGKDLPIGKFLALPKSIFNRAADMSVLPLDLTRESLDCALREATPAVIRKREEDLLASSAYEVGIDLWGLVRPIPPGFYAFDPSTREPGEDFEPGQLLPILNYDRALASVFLSQGGDPPEPHVEMRIRGFVPAPVTTTEYSWKQTDTAQSSLPLPDPMGPWPLTYYEHQRNEADRLGVKIAGRPRCSPSKPRRNRNQLKLLK
ncbi:MAG TPA: hypothetical protein VN397_04395 [Candidatus Methylomirabilis sp.]|nr:hypothetical protein [Candidatus Methylomirabilis sp.]